MVVVWTNARGKLKRKLWYGITNGSGAFLLLLTVLRSMVTATAFQILVINNAPIKATTDNAIITLEVSLGPNNSPIRNKIDSIIQYQLNNFQSACKCTLVL